ncbi:MAG: hypothetical protein Q7K54_02820 [Candidatus Parcubacteria bacterium]|nr:hypothetical protein [Candidatus Parcubacteria bacterium]
MKTELIEPANVVACKCGYIDPKELKQKFGEIRDTPNKIFCKWCGETDTPNIVKVNIVKVFR